MSGSDALAALDQSGLPDAREPLVRLLLHLSSLVCAVPWLRSLVLDPVRVGTSEAIVAGVHAVVDPKRRFEPGDYRHMALYGRVAQEAGIPRENILIPDLGTVIQFDQQLGLGPGRARVVPRLRVRTEAP